MLRPRRHCWQNFKKPEICQQNIRENYKFKGFFVSNHVDVVTFQESANLANTFSQKLLADFQKTANAPTNIKNIATTPSKNAVNGEFCWQILNICPK